MAPTDFLTLYVNNFRAQHTASAAWLAMPATNQWSHWWRVTPCCAKCVPEWHYQQTSDITMTSAAHRIMTPSLRFNSHFPDGAGLAGTRMFPLWILVELRMMVVVVTTGAITCTKLQSNFHHQQTNTQFLNKPDALPVAQTIVSEHWRTDTEKWLYKIKPCC